MQPVCGVVAAHHQVAPEGAEGGLDPGDLRLDDRRPARGAAPQGDRHLAPHPQTGLGRHPVVVGAKAQCEHRGKVQVILHHDLVDAPLRRVRQVPAVDGDGELGREDVGHR
jgi:hypothetical protein